MKHDTKKKQKSWLKKLSHSSQPLKNYLILASLLLRRMMLGLVFHLLENW